MKQLQVMKFGGTSVGDARCIRRAAEIVLAAARESAVVVVVSAMGGVTNRLISAAKKAVQGEDDLSSEIDSLRQQHIDAANVLLSDTSLENLIVDLDRITSETASLCRGISLLRELTPKSYATVSSVGERLSARLMAATLREVGLNSAVIESTEVVVTDDEYLQAEPLMREVRERSAVVLKPLLNDGVTPVVTGFIGATVDGVLTTLGRGGSDYSATTLGAALDANEIIIWTDVDGVLTADHVWCPKHVCCMRFRITKLPSSLTSELRCYTRRPFVRLLTREFQFGFEIAFHQKTLEPGLQLKATPPSTVYVQSLRFRTSV